MRGVLRRHPTHEEPAVPWLTWTIAPRSASSWSRDVPRSPRSRRACRSSAPAGCPDCVAARSPHSPGSASSTTASLNAARWPASLPRCSTRSPAPCNLTTPNGHTCSTSPTPPTAPARACVPGDVPRNAGRPGPACNGCSTSTPPLRSFATAAWTCSPSTTSAAACTPALYDRCTTEYPNFARYTFLDEDSHRFYPDWDEAADICVSILRTEAGRDPFDNLMHDLVGELSTRSDDFRRRWSAHDVHAHGAGLKYFHHRGRRQPRTRLRKRRHGVRTRTLTHLLRRRTRLPDRACPRPSGLVDGQPDGGDANPDLTLPR